MKFAPLVLAAMRRQWMRTLTVIGAVTVAFALLAFLETRLFHQDRRADDGSLIMVQGEGVMPESHLATIRAVPGVEAATGLLLTPFFGQSASQSELLVGVDPQGMLDTFRGLGLDEQTRKRWLQNRIGALCEINLLKRAGWKVNDHVSVGLPAGTRSGNAIEVDIVGTYEDSTTPGGLIVHYYYLVAAMPRMPMGNTLSNLYVRASAARDAPETAKRIDELFRNSAAPTQSAPWNSLLQQLSQSMRSMRLVMMSIVLASSFTMLVVVTSALAYSVHERIGEMAVLSGLGFQTPTLIALVVAEALLLLGIGCVAGLVLGQAGLAWSAAQPSQDSLLLPAHTVLVALGVVLASTAISAALPGWQIARMKVAERLHQL